MHRVVAVKLRGAGRQVRCQPASAPASAQQRCAARRHRYPMGIAAVRLPAARRLPAGLHLHGIASNRRARTGGSKHSAARAPHRCPPRSPLPCRVWSQACVTPEGRLPAARGPAGDGCACVGAGAGATRPPPGGAQLPCPGLLPERAQPPPRTPPPPSTAVPPTPTHRPAPVASLAPAPGRAQLHACRRRPPPRPSSQPSHQQQQHTPPPPARPPAPQASPPASR